MKLVILIAIFLMLSLKGYTQPDTSTSRSAIMLKKRSFFIPAGLPFIIVGSIYQF